MHNNVTAHIRTFVPFVVGFVMQFLALNGVEVPKEFELHLSGVLTLLLGAAYYAVVRLISEKFPQVEWLLGVPSKPEYKK